MAVNGCIRRKAGQINKKSIFDRTFCSRILFICLLFGALISADAEQNTCSNVKVAAASQSILSVIDLQNQPNSDVSGLCLNQGCCGPRAKTKLLSLARIYLDTDLKKHIKSLSDMLSQKAQAFNNFFKRLLRESREEFRSMFRRTYGMIYEQHSYVFEELFDQLEQYYEKGDVDLTESMDHFFGVLYERMFAVLNSQYSFNTGYLKCVNEHMSNIKPFADVPAKLAVQLRRAFVATRTFYKAIKLGADVTRSMIKMTVGDECVRAWARMRYCGTCGWGGKDKVPPCSRYCHNVLRGCLAKHADFSATWLDYLDAVDNVADRLMGPFNIVMVVEPIDIKISEAIMNFQEHNGEISKKIFESCGTPVLGNSAGGFNQGRSKRSARWLPELDWNRSQDDDFVLETSFENVLDDEPALLDLKSSENIPETVEKMKKQALIRARFLKYMRDEIDPDEYDSEDEKERTKRDVEPVPPELQYKHYSFENKKKTPKRRNNTDMDEQFKDKSHPMFEKLVRDTRVRARMSRKFWTRLPYLLCDSIVTDAPPTCFNGTHFDSYTLPSAESGTAALDSNPEVKVDDSTVVFLSEHATLKAITAKLKDAFNGADVHWPDLEKEEKVLYPPWGHNMEDRAGSGSGDFTNEDDEEPDTSWDSDGSGDGGNEMSIPDDEDFPQPKPKVNPEPESEPEQPIVTSGGTDFGNVRIDESKAINIDSVEDFESGDNVEGGENVVGGDSVEREDGVERVKSVDGIKESTSSADTVAVQKALFAYAMPIVCAWFGTMVTDLF